MSKDPVAVGRSSAVDIVQIKCLPIQVSLRAVNAVLVNRMLRALKQQKPYAVLLNTDSTLNLRLESFIPKSLKTKIDLGRMKLNQRWKKIDIYKKKCVRSL